MSVLEARGRGALLPSSGIPLAYFGLAHVCLAAAAGMLAMWPDLAGGYFYQPRMIALTHLLTLGWISGSILGAFYIVAPLALVTPLAAGPKDWLAFAAFAAGTIGMVAHFWIATYDGMAWSAGLVLFAIAYVARRAARGLSQSPVPPAVTLHVRLAFYNILIAGVLGIVIGVDRTRGLLGLSPVAATYAHAHLAALGWAAMMVIGLSYRLVPMLLPAAMPAARGLAASAILLEAGLAVLVVSLLAGWPTVPFGALLIVAALATFFTRLGRVARSRLPRPPALPRRDWSIAQVHVAFLWLMAAMGLGLTLALSSFTANRMAVAWIYGVAGLLGFLAQIITGMHGRLIPYYAWYRAMARGQGRPPSVSVHVLISSAHTRVIFFAWLGGIPLLATGLAGNSPAAVRVGALLLLAGVAAGGSHLAYIFRGAARFAATPEETPDVDSRRGSALAAYADHAH